MVFLLIEINRLNRLYNFKYNSSITQHDKKRHRVGKDMLYPIPGSPGRALVVESEMCLEPRFLPSLCSMILSIKCFSL